MHLTVLMLSDIGVDGRDTLQETVEHALPIGPERDSLPDDLESVLHEEPTVLRLE